MSQKPPCEKFIIATIRKIRNNPANLKVGSAGVGISRLWKVVTIIYSEREFCEGLQNLVEDGSILVTARHFQGRRSWDEVVTRIPDIMGSVPEKWYLDDGLNYTSKATEDDEGINLLTYIKVYVRADGLPKMAQKIIGTKTGNSSHIVHEILKSMENA